VAETMIKAGILIEWIRLYMIGIIADSHGHVDNLNHAIMQLQKKACQFIIHLGDICDSAILETVDQCIHLIIKNKLIAIKGNNDHIIWTNHNMHPESVGISKQAMRYIEDLPLIFHYNRALFVHSLPNIHSLGLSAMIRTMGKVEAAHFFAQYPKHVLFRGHSHTPEIMYLKNNHIETNFIQTQNPFQMNQHVSYIITCGALTRGHYMTWHTNYNTITSFSIFN